MRFMKYRKNGRRQRQLRQAAILLDLFLATLIFATCVISIGHFGSQSLHLARTTAIERLAAIKAESVLIKEVVCGPTSDLRIWQESLQNVSLSIRVGWTKMGLPHLHRIKVDIASANDVSFARPLMSLSRVVFVSEEE